MLRQHLVARHNQNVELQRCRGARLSREWPNATTIFKIPSSYTAHGHSVKFIIFPHCSVEIEGCALSTLCLLDRCCSPLPACLSLYFIQACHFLQIFCHRTCKRGNTIFRATLPITEWVHGMSK